MQFRKLNLILGWLSFAIALTVYLITLEPSVSLWDCGEFIAASYKLQVGHPPGAPLFMMIGRIFSLFTTDLEKVAMMINAVSAFASAFTILFLFWTISHLLKKMTDNVLVILGGSLVGALAYTFSDTFWFSAVEGEVYATSSLFTAVVFWAILKWENVADEPGANRWLILIAYLMGLSIGVHLLNLLAIPAIVLVYYFRLYPRVSRRGILQALALSFGILLVIMYGIIPGIVQVAGLFERFFTNSIGLHHNLGLLIYIVLLMGLLAWGIYRTQFVQKRVVLNTALLMATVIIIGYSSYAMIMIRSLASPPMNENKPDNVYSLLSYLNREQYGDRPLITGHQFDATFDKVVYEKPVYILDKEANRYVVSHHKPEVRYKGSGVLLPRMYSTNPAHKQAYEEFATIKDMASPSYLDNIEFFLRYQLGHMYLRYFMWNFAGKQNDVQGHGSVLNANWISGIKPLDSFLIGPQDKLPQHMKEHPARNRYFLLPLLLGLVGLFYHADRKPKDFWIVMTLFFMTGIAIVIYLNQTPYQPRERDYAYAGSFYAFAIWIGLSVAGLHQLFRKTLGNKGASIAATLAALLAAPVLMAAQNWNDHDRSGRYFARDIARNYLNSCAEDAILYTVGDNDTFPLWYAQDVEGVREDVRIVNTMLFNSDWYIEQARWKNYASEPLPMTLPQKVYTGQPGGSVYVRENEQRASIPYALRFILSDDPRTRVKLRSGREVNYLPAHKLVLQVDSAAVMESGTLTQKEAGKMVREIPITFEGNDQIYKNVLAQLDILGTNNWKRPIYYTSGGQDSQMGLEPYFRKEGLAYRLVPMHTPFSSQLDYGYVDTDTLYDRLMNTFSWGRMNAGDVHMDYYSQRTLNVIRFRSLYTRLAMELLAEGKKDKAIDVLDRCHELTPWKVLPYDQYITGITLPGPGGEYIRHEGLVEAYYLCGEKEKAEAISAEFLEQLEAELAYYSAMKPRHRRGISRDISDVRYKIETLQGLKSIYGLGSSASGF